TRFSRDWSSDVCSSDLTHSLLDTAMWWYQQGGEVLLIDEVHKYPNWSRELKNIYDGIPQLKVVFSASSALDIYRGQADLSRRVRSEERRVGKEGSARVQ